MIGNYHLGKELGVGQYAVVRAVSSIATHGGREEKDASVLTHYAMKKIDKGKILELKTLRRLRNEIGVLARLYHPNIVRLFSVVHTPSYIYMLLENGGKDLFEYLRTKAERLSDGDREKIFSQVVAAVAHLHRHEFVHRDLKPENILISKDMKVKIGDFGLCTHAIDDECTLTDFCGTPGFFPPEMVSSDKYSGYLADAWSMGCILLELCIGHESFVEIWMPSYETENLVDPHDFLLKLSDATKTDEKEMRDFSLMGTHARGDDPEAKESAPCDISEDCIEMVMGLLTMSAKKRCTVLDVERNPWFTDMSPPKEELTIDTEVFPINAPVFERSPESPNQLLKRRSLNFDKSPNGGHKVFTIDDIDVSKTSFSSSGGQLRLPLASPQTPLMRRAKNILWQGEKILDRHGLRPSSG